VFSTLWLERRLRTVDTLQPRLLPKEQTSSLTASVGFAVAACLEVNGIDHPPAPHRKYRVTRLVRTFVYSESLAAVLKHLRHEREAVELRVFIKRLEDLGFRANLDPFSSV
jgi:hypothetical protein